MLALLLIIANFSLAIAYVVWNEKKLNRGRV